jgi:chitin deacetylase
VVPVEWTNALNDAVKAGKIPNVPQSIQPDGPDSSPCYPDNGDPNSSEFCSSTYQCRGNGTIWDAPDGVFGSSFDDGPQPVSLSCLGFIVNLTSLTADCHAARFFEAE